MTRIWISLAAILALIGVVVACAPAAAPAPTAAPSKPAVAEPTKAPAAAPPTAPAPAPTTAPAAAAKVAFPEKGKAVTLIVPFAAGGSTDVQARILGPSLEKELGVPVNVVNKAGAGSQIGLTDLVNAKPDGYTIAFTNLPSTLMTYLDPDMKATYGKKNFQLVALQAVDSSAVAVKGGDGPYKTLKDFVDAAKANPDKLKSGTAGISSSQHVQTILFEKAAGVNLAPVHFDGGGPAITNMIGGHIDVVMTQVGETLPQVKSGNVRILGVMAEQKSEFLPDIPTLKEQGYDLVADSSRGMSLPAGTPQEIVKIWSEATKKAMESEQFKSKMKEQGIAIRYLDTPQYDAYWNSYEEKIKPIIPEMKKG